MNLRDTVTFCGLVLWYWLSTSTKNTSTQLRTTTYNYVHSTQECTESRAVCYCLRAELVDMKGASLLLACLGFWGEYCLAQRLGATPCAGVTNGNVLNPEVPDCSSFIRDSIQTEGLSYSWITEIIMWPTCMIHAFAILNNYKYGHFVYMDNCCPAQFVVFIVRAG